MLFKRPISLGLLGGGAGITGSAEMLAGCSFMR